MSSTFRLYQLSLGVRLGLVATCLVIAGGLLASASHLYSHYKNRDEVPGLTVADLEGAYHGVNVTAPMIVAMRRNHPPELPDAQRKILTKWLESKRINEDYDSPEAGDPSAIIASSCISCHAKNATKGDGIGKRIPLETLDEVRKVSFSRSIQPTPVDKIIASLHAHSLSLATLTIAVIGLLVFTRLHRTVIAVLSALIGVGLLVDLGCWLLAAENPVWVYGVIAGGAAYNLGTGVAIVVVVMDLLIPPPRSVS